MSSFNNIVYIFTNILIISKITIVPEGGANTYITPGDDFDANTTITFYSPPVDYNDATGTYE